jgi:chitinase
VTEGATVSLNGSGSTTGAGITYQWTQTAGLSVALTDADSIQASFTTPDVADGSETLTFRLTVSDADGNTATDTCTVTVSAQDAGEEPDDDHDGPGDTNNCFINSVFH